MRNSILIGVMVSCAIMGGILGGAINDAQRNTADIDAWSGVYVITKQGTLVANPSALSPRELANAKIIDPAQNLTICTDQSGNTFVNPREDECQDFKSIRHL